MHKKDKYSLEIVDEKDSEKFSESICKCDKCKLTHLSQKEWEFFEPKTNLQFKMKEVISNIEKKYIK
jgi:hypothetical protein